MIPVKSYPERSLASGGVKLRRLRGPFDRFAGLICPGQTKDRAARRTPQRSQGSLPTHPACITWNVKLQTDPLPSIVYQKIEDIWDGDKGTFRALVRGTLKSATGLPGFHSALAAR
jgi:hypothetical protein